MNVDMELVKSPTQAQYAYCAQCDQWLGCQYWSLAKSVVMHRRGTGHKATLFRLVAVNPSPSPKQSEATDKRGGVLVRSR